MLGVHEGDYHRRGKNADGHDRGYSGQGRPRLQYVVHDVCDEHIADDIVPVGRRLYRPRHGVAVLLVQAAERAHLVVLTRRLKGLHDVGRYLMAEMLAHRRAVGAGDDLAGLVGYKDLIAGGARDGGKRHAQAPARERIPVGDGGCSPRDLGGVIVHALAVVVYDVAAADADEAHRDEQEAHEHQRRRGHKVAQVYVFHYSVTSNL